MDKIKICEAMYALPGGVVVRRRKSLVAPVVLFTVGAALLVLNSVYSAVLTNNMRSALVFIGACLALTGAILCAVRGFGSTGAPYYSAGRCYLGYDELYFDRSEIATVTESIAAGNLSRLLTMPRAQVPAVTVCMYRSRDNGFVAMQAFEYVDLEYRPLTGLEIIDRNAA